MLLSIPPFSPLRDLLHAAQERAAFGHSTITGFLKVPAGTVVIPGILVKGAEAGAT